MATTVGALSLPRKGQVQSLSGSSRDWLQPDTPNDRDFVFSAPEVEQFTLDVERLDGGILQATYTIGLKDHAG